MQRLRAEPVTGVCTHHGEGPLWDDDHGVLRFVDMHHGGLMTYDPRSEAVSRRTLGTVAACVRPRVRGGLVVALERSFVLLDPAGPGDPGAGGAARELPPVFDEPGVRFNDGGCDPAGRFWMGTMNADGSPGGGSLHRLDPDGSTTRVASGLGVSNGLSFAHDGRTAYYVDTLTSRVDVLEVDPQQGTIVGRRPFVEVPEADGKPDGIAVDVDGGVWVALFGGSAVHRYGPDGDLTAVVEVDARQVTCPAFGGPELTDLYVTTSRENLDDDDDPLAGSLFRVPVASRGRPVLAYGG